MRIIAIAILAAAAALAFGVTRAGAVIVHIRDGQTVSYLPDLHGHHSGLAALARPQTQGGSEAGFSGFGKVSYHGGPVMSSNTDYAFYWAPGGTTEYPAGYISGMDRYFEDLSHDNGLASNVESVSAQYSDSEGEYAEYEVHFAGAIIDTDPYPPNGCHRAAICLTNEQLEGELAAYLSAHHLPENLTTAYFILTPPEAESCFEAAGLDCSAGTAQPEYCAYHGDYVPEGGTGPILYADDPYSTGIEGCDTGKHPSESVAEGTIQGGVAHEHAEMVSDPTLRAWFNSTYGEIGDLCRTFESSSELGSPLGTAADGAPFNQLINGHQYLYQQIWSNEADTCAQRRTWPVPAITGITPKGGPSIGGTLVKISGSELHNTKAVYFAGIPATHVHVYSGTIVEAEAPPGTTGEAHITLVTGHGASVETSRAVYKYGVPTISSLTPNHGPRAGGNALTVTGSGFGPATVFEFGKENFATEVNCTASTVCTMNAPPRAKAGVIEVRAKTAEKRSPRLVPGPDEYTYE